MPNEYIGRLPNIKAGGPVMIVVAGGTGRLGRLVVERLRGSGEEIRTMSRSDGDVRDPGAADRAIAGARVVISAISAFGATSTTRGTRA